jgi:CheY-like chemotaxis protein
MALRLEYPDKYRLWSHLIQGNTDRVFLATDQQQKIGSRVPVELSIPPLNVRLVIVGTVIGIRGRSEKFAAGAYLRFPDDEIDKCRRFLGLVQTPERYEQGRKSRRVPCALRVVLQNPPYPDSCTARNLSETGLLLSCPLEVYVSQRLQLQLTLDDGSTWPLWAEVIRERDAQHLVPLRFVEVSLEAAAEITSCIDRLFKQLTNPGATRPIVVADDDATILEFLNSTLIKYGYEVHTARRGEEALSLIRELKPKLVLLDILMPGLDGVDICKMMRADVDMAEIPVVFLSALQPDRLHVVADESGANDYLSKPVAMADLMNVVGAYLKP